MHSCNDEQGTQKQKGSFIYYIWDTLYRCKTFIYFEFRIFQQVAFAVTFSKNSSLLIDGKSKKCVK